jgi:hypothetical protein
MRWKAQIGGVLLLLAATAHAQRETTLGKLQERVAQLEQELQTRAAELATLKQEVAEVREVEETELQLEQEQIAGRESRRVRLQNAFQLAQDAQQRLVYRGEGADLAIGRALEEVDEARVSAEELNAPLEARAADAAQQALLSALEALGRRGVDEASRLLAAATLYVRSALDAADVATAAD